MPVQPRLRPRALHRERERRDAAVHPIEVDGIDHVRPFERLPRVVHHQGREPGRVGIAARERVVVGGERLQGRKPGPLQRRRGRHARSAQVGLSGPDHGGADVAQLRQVPLAQCAARLDHRGHPLVEHIEQHLRELRAGRIEGHGVRAHRHHGANDFLLADLGAGSEQSALAKSVHLRLLDQRPVGARQRIAVEDHRLALVARTPVEPVNRNPLGASLQQQAVVVGLAPPGLVGQRDLRAVARDHDDLIDGELAARQRDRAIRHGRHDRRVPGGGNRRRRAEGHAGTACRRARHALRRGGRCPHLRRPGRRRVDPGNRRRCCCRGCSIGTTPSTPAATRAPGADPANRRARPSSAPERRAGRYRRP